MDQLVGRQVSAFCAAACVLVRSEAGLLVDAGTVVRFGDFVVRRFSTRPGAAGSFAAC